MSSRLRVRSAWSTCRAALAPCSKHSVPAPRTRPAVVAAAAAYHSSTVPIRSRGTRGTEKRSTPAATPAASTVRRPYSTEQEPPEEGEGADEQGPALPKRGRREMRQQIEEGGEAAAGIEGSEAEFDPDDYFQERGYDISDDMLDSLYGPAGGKSEDKAAEVQAAAEGEAQQTQEDLESVEGQLFPGGELSDVKDFESQLFGEGGLTLEQQQTLYESGVIPPPVTGDKVTDDLHAAMMGEPIPREAQKPHTRVVLGRKFDLPKLPLPPGSHLKFRYHPVLHQFTNLLMRDGKLSSAQKIMADMLNFLRTAPPPIPSPKYPLLPGAPPAAHLPLNPVLYLTLAVDSVAPLIKIKRLKGLAGGGAALELPVPLPVRNRRRTAFLWILDIVNKKPSFGSGRKQYASRLASEIISVVEGSSSVWEKRDSVHKQGTTARANMFLPAVTRRKKR